MEDIAFYKDMEENPTFIKCLDFAIRMVHLYEYLRDEKKENVMSKQILRSGTSIGANYSEALASESKEDFIHKCSIALKEGNETKYWLMLLLKTHYISDVEYQSLIKDCQEIRKILGSTIKTSKKISRF